MESSGDEQVDPSLLLQLGDMRLERLVTEAFYIMM